MTTKKDASARIRSLRASHRKACEDLIRAKDEGALARILGSKEMTESLPAFESLEAANRAVGAKDPTKNARNALVAEGANAILAARGMDPDKENRDRVYAEFGLPKYRSASVDADVVRESLDAMLTLLD